MFQFEKAELCGRLGRHEGSREEVARPLSRFAVGEVGTERGCLRVRSGGAEGGGQGRGDGQACRGLRNQEMC